MWKSRYGKSGNVSLSILYSVIYVLVLTLCAQVSFGELVITPVDAYEAFGEPGGPFAPSMKEYLLRNTEGSQLFWGLEKSANWIDVSPTWSLLDPNESLVVTVTINSQANTLGGGVYSDTILFTDSLHSEPQSREVILTIASAPGVLEILPVEDFEAEGLAGGPFTPAYKEYSLRNIGGSGLFWGADKAVDWLDIDPTWGQLDPNETVVVTASLNATADLLGEGIYDDTLVFTDVSSSEEQTRAVTLTILEDQGLWVDPEQFEINLIQGTSTTETLTIGNNGASEVNFQLRSYIVSGPAGADDLQSDALPLMGQAAALEKVDFTKIADVPYKEGEILVRFSPAKNGKQRGAAEKQAILSALGNGAIKREFNVVPGLTVVSLPPGFSMEEALEKYNNTDGIAYAQPNYQVHALALPNDSRFGELWGLHNTGQSGGTVDADIDAPEAWDIATGNGEVVVAVIDTGVDYTHPDLAGNMWVNEPEMNGTSGVDDDQNGYVDDIYGYDFDHYDGDPMDDHYHGTHCAGTIGASGNNGMGVAGVNWQVKIMALKFLDSGGSGWTDDAINCVEYSMQMGASLSSNSWGGGSYSQALQDAINAAGAAGMLFVAAAGNDSSNNDQYPAYPASYDCQSIISVMATDKNDNRSSFSNYGLTSVDLGAPGSEILSCEPGNSYQYLNGTSMATPHVSGACALIWSLNLSLSNLEVKQLLLDTVDPTLVNQCVSGGRLNLYNAVSQLNVPWISMIPETGVIQPDGTVEISITFDSSGLAVGTYQAEIVVQSDDVYHPEIVIPVTLTVVPDDLTLSPEEDFESSGDKGGPFTPASKSYTLENTGSVAHSWEIVKTADWFDVSVLSGSIDPNASLEIEFSINANADSMEAGIYTSTVEIVNLDSGSVKYRTVSLQILPPDTFTESFNNDDVDLAYKTLTFRPAGNGAYYAACVSSAAEFPVDPEGGVPVALGDDDFAEIVPADGAVISFYGQTYDRFYLGSNGYITFSEGDEEYDGTIENHFLLPRISALFTDLTPPDSQCISWKQLPDRVAVTWQQVPLWADKDAKNSFQIELFFADEMVRVTYLNLAADEAVAGLSQGNGIPYGFAESNLNEYLKCCPCGDLDGNSVVELPDVVSYLTEWLRTDCTGPDWCNFADTNRDNAVDIADFAPISANWLQSNGYKWSEPVNHTELNDPVDNRFAMSPCLSRDGLTIYYRRDLTGVGQLFHAAHRDIPSGPFTSEEVFEELYQGTVVGSPWISSDELRLYYWSHYNSGSDWVLKQAARTSKNDPWVIQLTFTGIHINDYIDSEPSLTKNELTLYWQSNRPGGYGVYSIWEATRNSIDEPFDPATVRVINELNTNYEDGNTNSPCILPDGLTIYFGSNRMVDGQASGDIYKATRNSLDESFGNIEMVGVSDPTVGDYGPYVTPDESEIYYQSGLGGGVWFSYITGDFVYEDCLPK